MDNLSSVCDFTENPALEIEPLMPPLPSIFSSLIAWVTKKFNLPAKFPHLVGISRVMERYYHRFAEERSCNYFLSCGGSCRGPPAGRKDILVSHPAQLDKPSVYLDLETRMTSGG